MAYEQELTVRFDDVDYAQIVYFPRLFGYCHWVFEDFFAQEAGISYAELLSVRRVGFPTVHAEADFKAPLRFGDPVLVRMETVKLGTRSVTNRYQLRHRDRGQLCAEVELVTVAMSLDEYRSLEMPEDIRVAFLNHLVGYTSA
jgi:4-hydroxybenzoyl-CoA thioesterase